MSSPSRSVSRYQRRILAWGVGLTCLLYVVGAPIYLDAVESDLTERVGAELVEAGFEDVSVSFSGQTGSFRCREPLSDPRAALDVAFAVWGVRSMEELPDECRVLTGAPDDTDDDGTLTSGTTTIPGDEDAGDDAAGDDASTTTTTDVHDFDSVLAVLGGNPQFSLLYQLVEDAGIAGDLSGNGALTLFAPTDDAFDALPADAVAQLRSDVELLRRVLLHHVVEERLTVDQLVDGALPTANGDEITIDLGGAAPQVDGASIVEPDVLAANGVVHAIDRLLLPADVDLSAPEQLAPVSAAFDDGRYVLQGVVRSEVERTLLVTAAATAVGEVNTVDELTVDPDRGIGESDAQQLGTLVAAVPVHLVAGTVDFDGEMLSVVGVYADEAGRAAIEELAELVDATASLSEAEAPQVDDAAVIEAELNAFVAENPILFEPTASVLDESAQPVLDEIARRVQSFVGISVTVEGHTDSDGDPQANLVLSQQRALTVVQALIERGVDESALASEGFGSTRPILVDGVEDKDASRRVEFRVEVR